MAFKHIRSIISEASTDQTLYTVPSGKEFVLLRTRARYEGEQSSSGDGAPPAQISYKGYDMFSDMSGTASLATNFTYEGNTYDYCYALKNGYYIVYPYNYGNGNEWALYGWAGNGSSTTPVGRYTAPNGSYIDVTDAGGSSISGSFYNLDGFTTMGAGLMFNGDYAPNGTTLNGYPVYENENGRYLYCSFHPYDIAYYCWGVGTTTSSFTTYITGANAQPFALEQGTYSTGSGESVTVSLHEGQQSSSSSGGSSTGSNVYVSFKVNSSNAFETIDIGSNAVAKGQTWKTLHEAGSIIKANATVADAMAEIMGLELKAGTWESVGGNGGSYDSVTITYTADTQRSVVLNATEYTSYGETVYRGDSGQTYQGNTVYIWLYKGSVSGTQYWGATMTPQTPTFNGNDVYANWYAYSTTLINSDYTEVGGTWSNVSVSQTSGGGDSSSSAWGGSNTLVASGFSSIAIPGGFITSPNGTYTYNASTDRYEYADSGDDVLFYINNTHDAFFSNEVYYQLRYRYPKTSTVESENTVYGQTSQTLTSQGTWLDIEGTMSLDPDAVVTV